jgi:hypothetical protein
VTRHAAAVVLTVLIAALFVFAWTYARPDPMTPFQAVLAGALGLVVTVGAYVVATAIVGRLERD